MHQYTDADTLAVAKRLAVEDMGRMDGSVLLPTLEKLNAMEGIAVVISGDDKVNSRRIQLVTSQLGSRAIICPLPSNGVTRYRRTTWRMSSKKSLAANRFA